MYTVHIQTGKTVSRTCRWVSHIFSENNKIYTYIPTYILFCNTHVAVCIVCSTNEPVPIILFFSPNFFTVIFWISFKYQYNEFDLIRCEYLSCQHYYFRPFGHMSLICRAFKFSDICRINSRNFKKGHFKFFTLSKKKMSCKSFNFKKSLFWEHFCIVQNTGWKIFHGFKWTK